MRAFSPTTRKRIAWRNLNKRKRNEFNCAMKKKRGRYFYEKSATVRIFKVGTNHLKGKLFLEEPKGEGVLLS